MPSVRLQDKVAIVTGSSSGVGRATAILYAKEGARVVCADLRTKARSEISGETISDTHDVITSAGGSAIFVQCNVGRAADVENLVHTAVVTYGRLDVIVNNAGVALEPRDPQPIHLTPEETWDITMTVNAKSVFLGCKYAIAQMLAQEQHPSGVRGWIVNIASIYGLVGGGRNPSYCASKGAVVNLTRQIALDYSENLIHCNAIAPGHVQTAIFAETTQRMVAPEAMNQMYPFKGPGTPEDIAKMAVVLASDDASWMTGACVSVDGGYVAR